jgi:MFS family permease
LSAIQNFASPALERLYSLPLSVTAFVVTGYMLCGAFGMAVGGFMAAKVDRLERVISVCLTSSAAVLCAVGLCTLPGTAACLLTATAGFGVGLAAPSRDMLIKRAAPAGATGRIYGTVYAGLDLGFALSAPLFGAMLDRGTPQAVFFGAALALALGVGSALLVGLGRARH